MITIFTTFKAFEGQDGFRQRRAVRSWRESVENAEIMLFGNPLGAAAVVREFGLLHFPDVPVVEGRLVLIDKMFELSQAQGRYDLQMYCNGDIIFGSDLVRAVTRIRFPRFLAVGRRWNVDLLKNNNHENQESAQDVQNACIVSDDQDSPYAMDYFAFRRGSIGKLPPLSVGTIRWDNYMVKWCWERNIPVVDMSPEVKVFHQRHGYAYLNKGASEFVSGTAAMRNLKIAQTEDYLFSTLDATHLVRDGQVCATRSEEYVMRRLERLQKCRPSLFRLLILWKMRYLMCLHAPWL